jgi:hypothetical protein
MRTQLLRWVRLLTLAEAVGFTVPTAVGTVVTRASWGPVATLIGLVLAGSVEGALLGTAQADCLYRWGVLPVRRQWVAATTLAAAVAWSLGMLPSTLGGLNWTAVTAVAVGIGGLMLLTSLPLAQYFVLRDHVRRAVMDPDQYRRLAIGDCVDAGAVALGRRVNTHSGADLDIRDRWTLHGRDGCRRHRHRNNPALATADRDHCRCGKIIIEE